MTRPIPPALWLSLIVFGLMTLIQLVLSVGTRNGPLLLAVLLNVVLIVGLYRAARWAFVLTLVFGVAGVLVALVRSPAFGLGAVVGNALVLVPLILAREYFFAPPRMAPSVPRYCPHCGRPLTSPPTPNCPVCNPG